MVIEDDCFIPSVSIIHAVISVLLWVLGKKIFVKKWIFWGHRFVSYCNSFFFSYVVNFHSIDWRKCEKFVDRISTEIICKFMVVIISLSIRFSLIQFYIFKQLGRTNNINNFPLTNLVWNFFFYSDDEYRNLWKTLDCFFKRRVRRYMTKYVQNW